MIKKNLCLIKKFYKDIRLSSLLLFIVFLLAQFSMLSLIGKYRTCMYYDRCYKHIPDVERSVYYGYEANLMTGTSDTNTYQCILDEISQRGCVERILYMSYLGTIDFQGESINILAMDGDLLRCSVGLEQNSKDWNNTGIDKEGNLQIILTPKIFSNHDLRDKINLQVTTNGQTVDISAVISGRYKTVACLPNFNQYSNKMDYYDMLSEYTNTIFVPKTPETEKLLMKNDIYDSKMGFIIFTNDSTEAERSSILEELNQLHFSFNTYEDIISNSNHITEEQMKNALLLPMLAFVLTFLFSVSMILLMLDKKMETYSIYYLYGLSKKKSYFLILGSIGCLELLAFVINAAVNIFYCHFPERRPELIRDIQFSWDNLYLLLVQAVIILGIIFLEIFVTYHRKSFIEIKNQELK